MGVYALNDQLVREALTDSPKSHAARDLVWSDLEKQLPLEVPTGLGAVVRCDVQLTAEETTLFVRYSTAAQYPWVQAGVSDEVYSDREIGRIVKVESEGITLEPPYHETDD